MKRLPQLLRQVIEVKQGSKPKFGRKGGHFPLQFCRLSHSLRTSGCFFFFLRFSLLFLVTRQKCHFGPSLTMARSISQTKVPFKKGLTLQARSPSLSVHQNTKQTFSRQNTSSACLRRHQLLPFSAICCRCKPLLHSSPVPPPVQTTEGLRVAWPQRLIHESQQP